MAKLTEAEVLRIKMRAEGSLPPLDEDQRDLVTLCDALLGARDVDKTVEQWKSLIQVLQSSLAATLEREKALRGQMGYMKGAHVCAEGWVCETHPWLGWPHNDCAGPGMPCGFRRDESSVIGSAHHDAALEGAKGDAQPTGA